MAKSSSGRRAGSATRSVYTGGAPRQLKAPVYGKTADSRCGNPNQHLGAKISGCNPNAHQIGAPRNEK